MTTRIFAILATAFLVIMISDGYGQLEEADSTTILIVSSNPSGAIIFVGDDIFGRTPNTIRGLNPGKHIVKIVREAYEEWITTIYLEAGRRDSLRALLSPQRGRLQVDADVFKAEIFVDDQFMGLTPQLIRDIEYGKHRVIVQKGSFKPFEVVVDIATPEVTVVNAILGKSWLSMTGSPEGAVVRFYHKVIGKIPFQDEEIQPGMYQIHVTHDGYETSNLSVTIDSRERKNIIVNLTPRTQKKVIFRSILFPGIGQFYSGKQFRGFLYVMAELGAITGAIITNVKMKELVEDYNDVYQQYQESSTEDEVVNLRSTVNEKYNQIEKTTRARNLLVGTAAAVWILNLADAYFLGKKFDNGIKLGKASLRPDFQVASHIHAYAMGLNLSISY